jgi:riboflavin transporter FmnP
VKEHPNRVTRIDVQTLSASAIFAALSAILTFLPTLNFVFLPYLQFQIAELPIMIGALIYGPIAGVISAFAYWLILNFVGTFQPLGPLMAFLAVMGLIIGAWIGINMAKKIGLKSSGIFGIGLILTFGALIRIILMSVLNYVIIWILMPSFFILAVKSLGATLGLQFQSNVDALIVIMVFTAVFNIIQTLLSVIPSYSIVKIIFYKRNLFKKRTPWMSSSTDNSNGTRSNS